MAYWENPRIHLFERDRTRESERTEIAREAGDRKGVRLRETQSGKKKKKIGSIFLMGQREIGKNREKGRRKKFNMEIKRKKR